MREQTFGRNLPKSPSHLNLRDFSLTSKHFPNNDVNINQVSSVKSSPFNGFLLALFCIFGLRQNFTLENFFLNDLTFLSQNRYFFQKVESSMEEQKRRENFRLIFVIISASFLINWLRSESP